MIETKEKTINGAKYSVVLFPARFGLRIKTELVKLLAPTLLSMASKQDMDVSKVDLSAMIRPLVDSLHEDKVIDLVMRLFSSTRRNDKEITESAFDSMFAGNYGEMYQALRFVVEVNYGSFFQEIGIGKVKENLVPISEKKTKMAS